MCFFKSIGGGRIHYCGITREVIDDFFEVPGVTGLDLDSRHNFFDLCEHLPRTIVLICGSSGQNLNRLLSGDWPRKRNIIILAGAESVEEGKDLLERLRASIPY